MRQKPESPTKPRFPSRSRSRKASEPSAKTGRSSPREFGLKRLLVPIDFSPASLYPIQWAKFISRRTKVSIHFVNVHDFGYPVPMALTPPVIGSEAEIKDHLHRDLQAVAISQNVLDANFQIRVGRAFEQICQVASEIQANLILLATHGRTGWERALLGSTAERVIRYAPCPVLVARRPSSRRKARLKLGKIVVPVDFSDCSAQGLHYAVELAQLFGAELSLLNVVQLHHDLPPVVVYTHAELRRWAREVAQAHMADLLRATDFCEVKFEVAVKMGSPAQKVCRYAQQIGADLIVTATHGRTGLRHVLMGSTAEQIVRYAKTPVLVVPSRERAEG
jgi:nucleotide-binding universal stress UspA family protein